MTQTPEYRRLVRLAHSMNRKAQALGVPGRVTADILLAVETATDACHYCGIELESGTFDHVKALDKGGPNTYLNIVRSCLTCNREKHTKAPHELAEHRARVVACARPGCPNTFKPRWAEWQAGRARLCSRRCSALVRHHGYT